MSAYKAKIDFSGYAANKLVPVAETVQSQMNAAGGTFSHPPIDLDTLQADIETFAAALAKKASRATADVVACRLARHILEADLATLGNYVNGLARGDRAIVVASGFPSYDTGANRPDPHPPAAPRGLTLRQGKLSGSFVARYRPARRRSVNEVQICTGDPNVETHWQHAGMFTGGKATVGGIVPGTAVWGRVRTAGIKGVMGAWSDPARIMVV